MRSPDDPPCKFSLSLSLGELRSLQWLLETVGKIEKNPKSCNRQKAALAGIAIEKMRDALLDMHAELHLADEKITEQAEKLALADLLSIHGARRSSTEGMN